MKLVMIMMSSLLMGCMKPGIYRLYDGEIVKCATIQESECGVYLGDCEWANGVEYLCQRNVMLVDTGKLAI